MGKEVIDLSKHEIITMDNDEKINYTIVLIKMGDLANSTTLEFKNKLTRDNYLLYLTYLKNNPEIQN
jgi:hypothetical protein